MPTIDEILSRTSHQLEKDAKELARRVIEIMNQADRFPEWMQASPVFEAAVEMTAESIIAEQRLLRGGELPEELPAADLALVDEAVENSSPVSMILDGYRAGQTVQVSACREVLDSTGTEAQLAREVVERAQAFMFAYAGRMTEMVTEVYLDARQRRLRTQDHLRQSTVRALLDGEEPGDNPLDYPAAGHHIAVVTEGRERLETLEQLAKDLDARVLVFDRFADPWWAWLGRSGAFDHQADSIIIERLARPSRAGVSSIGTSYAGFREGHRQALVAFKVSQSEGRGVTFAEIAAEDLACRDRAAARRFCSEKLSFLAASSARSQRLRDTLLAYFAAGHNNRAAAASLGVHHQTVASRLAAVESHLGATIADLRLDLELALRLERFLAATDDPDGTVD